MGLGGEGEALEQDMQKEIDTLKARTVQPAAEVREMVSGVLLGMSPDCGTPAGPHGHPPDTPNPSITKTPPKSELRC